MYALAGAGRPPPLHRPNVHQPGTALNSFAVVRGEAGASRYRFGCTSHPTRPQPQRYLRPRMKHLFLGALLLVAAPALAQRPTKARPKPTAAPAADKGPYFQQEVNYSIDVKLDDRAHVLRGREELTYVNNSPKPLAFKKASARLAIERGSRS